MNTAHWHLLLNHTPIIGVFIGILILITGLIFKAHPPIKRTALGVFIFAAIFSILAYLTGEGAEEVVEGLPDVTEPFIEDHEDAGKFFLVTSGVLGLLSLVTFVFDLRSKASTYLYIAVLILAVATSGLGIRTGLSGGQVRHSEIRSGGATQKQEQLKPRDDKDE